MVVGNQWLLAISLLAVAAIGASYLLYRRKVTPGGVLRFLAAASIVASFGGIQLEIVRDVPLSVYALDASESFALERLSAVEAIRTHAAGMSASSQAALVTFSTTAALEGPVEISSFRPGAQSGAGLGKGATSIEAGLKAAASLEGRADRIYLFSDGRANRGKIQEGALVCSQAGIRVFPVVLSTPIPADAWVSRVEAPVRVSPGEPVRVFVHAGSNRAGELKVSLAAGAGRFVREIEASGTGQAQRVEFELRFKEPGIKPLLAQVSAMGFSDGFPANNSARGALRVAGLPRVLVCTARASSAAGKLLGGEERFSIVRAGPEDLPEAPGRLQDAAAVILDNVSAHDLSKGQMGALKRYVRDLGGGLVVLGGPDSYGPGGYIETVLEEALPVWCNPEKRKKASLVFVLDASGSMGEKTEFLSEGQISKFRAALRAIVPVYRHLKKGDEVAIVTFNTRPTLELPLTADDDGRVLKSALTGELAAKEPTGKTNIYPALREAFKLLEGKGPEEREERILHVILLSDGRQTIEDTIDLGKFREAGVSVSAVATGETPDRERLKNLAQTTGGDYYEVIRFDAKKLLEVFPTIIREGLSELKRTGEIEVNRAQQAEFLKGIGDFPGLGGIALTEGKDGAHVVARTPEEEPVLAWWRLGLGKAIAFTGALDDIWGREWLEWDSLGKLLSQAVRWSAAGRDNPDFSLTATADGLTVRACLLARGDGVFAGGLSLRAVFSFGESDAQRVDAVLDQAGPGEYEAEVLSAPDRLCVVTVYRETGEVLTSTEVWVPGTLESGPQGADVEALSILASLTGGEVLSEEAFLADMPEGRGGRGYDLWWVLLILAGCFFLADIAQSSLLGARRLK